MNRRSVFVVSLPKATQHKKTGIHCTRIEVSGRGCILVDINSCLPISATLWEVAEEVRSVIKVKYDKTFTKENYIPYRAENLYLSGDGRGKPTLVYD